MANIDYGMGRTNIDTNTLIRFGVISQHSMADWFYDEFEAQYAGPNCPKCGNEATDNATEINADNHKDHEEFEHLGGCADYRCDECRITFDSSEAFGEEPIGHKLEDTEYLAIDCLDSDVMIIRAPFYTLAPFCSPCVPGAGNLDNANTPTEPLNEEWSKAYCFGHDYFEDHRAPYRVFSVATGEEVLP